MNILDHLLDDDLPHESNPSSNQNSIIITLLSLIFCVTNPILAIFLAQKSAWLDLIWLIPAYTIISFLSLLPFALTVLFIMVPCLFIYDRLQWKILDWFVPFFKIPYLIIEKIKYNGFWLIANIIVFGILIYLGFTDSTSIDFKLK